MRCWTAPAAPFLGAGETVVLFFEKGAPTRRIWFYQLDPGRNLGKTNPLNDDDLADFVALEKSQADSPRSWSVAMTDVDRTTWDLSVKNPHAPDAAPIRPPEEILDEIEVLDAEAVRCWRRSGGCCDEWMGNGQVGRRMQDRSGWNTAKSQERILSGRHNSLAPKW